MHLRARRGAGVVAAVAQDDQHLALEAALLHVVEAGVHRVVNRRLSSRLDGLHERDPQGRLRCVNGLSGGKRRMKIFVEAEDEELILRIHGFRERHACGDHQVAIGRHAAARVDEQADGDRRVLVVEEADFLRLFVLENAKRVLTEAADVAALLVPDGDVQDDQLGLRRKIGLASAPARAGVRGDECQHERGWQQAVHR